jgi:hypothetical protein
MVFPGRWLNSPNYNSLVKINNAIRSGQVRGFMSEGFATVEAISKRNRAKFHAQNIPTVEVTPNRLLKNEQILGKSAFYLVSSELLL